MMEVGANDLPFDPDTVAINDGEFTIDGKPAILITAERGNIEAMKVLLDRGEIFRCVRLIIRPFSTWQQSAVLMLFVALSCKLQRTAEPELTIVSSFL